MFRHSLSRIFLRRLSLQVYGLRSAVSPQLTSQSLCVPLSGGLTDPQLISDLLAFRTYGHLRAELDPLRLWRPSTPRHQSNGESNAPETVLPTSGAEKEPARRQFLERLERVYSGPLSAEFMHCQSAAEREWFAEAFEQREQLVISNRHRVQLAQLLLRSQAFDRFLGHKFVSVKRYSGEGAEALLIACDTLYRLAARGGIQHVVQSLGHRGRNNLLTCLLNYPPVIFFQKMEGKSEFPPDAKRTIGDVFSHFFTSTRLEYAADAEEDAALASVNVSVLPGPSHLEANVPPTIGKARMKMRFLDDLQPGRIGERVLCFLVHGDAAFAGQGVVWEMLSMSATPKFSVGGSVHLVVNNQIGYTTDSAHGRSSRYATDLAKAVSAPVIHVNGDSIEDVVRAVRLAFAYRQRFRREVFIDLVCYRLHGHNELDDPTFTQPLMYRSIRQHRSPPDAFAERLVTEQVATADELNKSVAAWNTVLDQQLALVHSYVPPKHYLEKEWHDISLARTDVKTTIDTGVPVELLRFIGIKSVAFPPQQFAVHPTILKTHVKRRLEQMGASGTAGSLPPVDWGTAEALALGSLLVQGVECRIGGQDVARGTFSHRHFTLIDQQSERTHTPLNHLFANQRATVEVANSILSEYGALGFEVGASYESPNLLCIWEAQFGDFFNGAQIIFDTYISTAERKWQLHSGLVVLLPHGMDGAGPEHSSCRIERFLQCTDSSEINIDGDDVNMYVVNPTTPAQYFHLLRRQMARSFRKPLIVVAPKILLRHPAAGSMLTELAPGTSFSPVLDDPLWSAARGTATAPVESVRRIIFCSGKLFYSLDQRQREMKTEGEQTALIRLEELCPFPASEIRQVLARYPRANQFVWAQEEHRNSGAWSFVRPRFLNLLGLQLRYAGRDECAAPAVAIGEIHRAESDRCINAPFASIDSLPM